MPSISTASLIQSINLGAQSNDGTGDAIRDAFNKVNQNFATIAGVLGVGSGLYFTKLIDTPHVLSPNKLIVTNPTGLTLTQVSLVGRNGIQLTLDQTAKTLTVDATITNIVKDPNPILANNLSGNYVYRGINFVDPVDDQDIATKKWIYDNFVNRDANYQYISATNPITGANVTSTIVEGSTLRHNIQLIPGQANTSTNTGKTITVFTASGTTSTVDISRGQWLPSHLTRKDYVDTKISLQGISTIDPFTGQVNKGFGQMTGGLELFRGPAETDSPLIAATKGYVDENSPLSKINFYVSLAGKDARYEVPSYKRGRSLAYAFKSIGKAAQAAIESQAVSEIKLGPYQRFITTDNYQSNVQISSTATSLIPNAIKLNVTYNGGLGTDPFKERSIRPGMFIQGADSNAMANILNISLSQNSNVEEYYEVSYVDYAQTFVSAITADKLSGDVTFTLFNYNLVPIPDFWIGYIFQLDQNVGGQSGKIISVSTSYDPNGNVYDTFTVRMSSPLTNLNTIAGDRWHVYSGYFIQGENLRYGQKYNKLEISLIVESGEYNEQFPIRMADNVSLRGDEFRRTIFKPAYVNGTARASISTSPWVNIWFRRDTQVDGLITCAISTTTDYASTLTAVSVIPSSVTNDATTGVTTFTLTTSSAVTTPKNWINKVFVQYNPDGKTYSGVGTITAVNQNTFFVNLAENYNNQRSIGSTATIASGSWHVFDPINFGYHYLRDPSKPANYIAGPNSGGHVHAYNIIQGNIEFLKEEIFGYVNQKYSGQFVLDPVKCKRDIGIQLNAIAYDLKFGDINQSINAADSFVSDPSILSTSYAAKLPLTIDMVGYMNTILQRVLINVAPVTKYSVAQQTLFSYNAESVALFTVADLTSAMQAILNKDPSFNPAKYNDQLDVFLMNDATILRYCGGQGHGGFMKVLDPEGQIKSKSPYTQTCSSFSRSTGHHTFAGGMLVDGFCGNLPLTVTTPGQAAQADTLGNLIFIPVSGLIRKPQFPCFFIDNGISYEVDYMNSYNALAGTAVIALNSNNPGGFQSVSIQNAAPEFQPSRTQANPIYCTFINPGIAGAISAKGFVTTDASGLINGFNVTFPGKGYVGQPTIIVGQATFNFTIVGGVITAMTVNNGGTGYTTGTKLTISSPGGGGTPATATITAVDVNGAITSINLSYGGTGYSLSVTPTVTFGQQSFSAVLKNGFVGPLPYNIELNTAGNRSMLANDYTQINDLGYGVFATNGGLIENVSMFTYYNWTSYYALNGAQVRSITGSSCYGFYGLVSEGSNPLEIPTPVTLPDQLAQVATVYNQAPYQNIAGGAQFYVTIDPTYGYAPFAGSEVEVNHYGIRKIYNIQNASQVVGNVYVLSIDTTAIGGIYAAIPDGSPVTIRLQTQFRLYGLNASAVTRPSTVLTLNEESTYIYRILNYVNLGSDYVLAESEEAYDYISITPYTKDSTFSQGIGRPNFVSTGSGYTTTASWTATIVAPTIKSAVVLGNQGTAQIGVTQLSIASASGNIHPGMTISGAGVLSGQKVLWASTDNSVIQTTLAQAWTASTALSFIGSTATAYATSNQATGYITDLVITDPGIGYDIAPAVTIWPSPVGVSGNASVTVSLSGMVGSTVIKTANIKSSDIARINTGLTAAKPYYYQFGYEGQMYKITKYVPAGTRNKFNDTSATGGAWNEIEFVPINSVATTLTKEFWYSSTQPLYAGIEKNQGGAVTIQISTMRATGHDMLNVGTGGYASSKYPNDLYGPPTYLPDAGKITREVGKGRVYSVTTDQDGNFRVGKYFSVDQGRGTVTINAPIALSGISKLSFKKGVEVDNFSIDETMAGNNPRTVPTESAIVGYVGRRLGFDTSGGKTSVLGPGAIATNGVIPMAAPLNMAGNKVTNVGTPTGGTDAANKDYADDKISKRGTNELFYKGGQGAGVMSGSLILNGDPKVVTHVLSAQVNNGDGLLYLDSVAGLVPGMQVTYDPGVGAFNFIGGTTVTNVSTTSNVVSISPNAIGTVAPSTTLYFDSVYQAANKRYVDSQSQIAKMRDVSLANTADGDLMMFGSNITASSSTVTPLYNSARQVVNVANSTTTIINTPLTRGGGSDVTITRNGRFAVVKLVGGQGSTNPITDHHINTAAAIQQSKLALQDAKALYNTAPLTFNQSLLGVATFNSTQFSASNGWVSINLTSNLTTQGLSPSQDGTYDLGTTGNKYNNVYANTLFGAIDAGQIGGTLGIEHGGTAAGTASGALTNILAGASNSPSVGFVLKASGTGQYYWGQELGGGLQTGTKILTQRLATTVASDGQTVFTAPTYTVGSGQLRVYVNGVRQSVDAAKTGGADYTETSTTTFTLGTGLKTGDYVLAEVDGYYFFQVNANSVAYTASFPLTANNLQDAVDQLNANKYEKSGGTISGDVTINTGKSLYLAAGTSSKPTLKLIAGTVLSAPQVGAIEFDGTYLYYTQTAGTTRMTVASQTYVNAQGFLKFADNITSANTSTYSTYAVYAQIAQTSTYAAIAPWNGLTGTPPSNTIFANGAAYLTSSGTIDNAVTASSANALNSANNYQVNRLGIGGALGAAYLTVAAGTTLQSAIQLNVGSTLTNTVVGAVEWDGNNLYITSQGPTRQTMAYQSWVVAQGYQTASGNVQQSNFSTTATYVVNGVYTTGSYPNPSWIPSYDVSKVTNGVSSAVIYSNPSFIGTLDAGKLTGTIPSSVQGGTNVYIGTTAVALNRTSGNLDLAGITNLQMPGSSSGGITLTPAAVAGSNTLTLPAKTATLAVLGDTFYIGTTQVANNRATGTLALAGINTLTMPGATSGNTILQPSATGSPTITMPSATGTLDLVGATFYIGTTAITNNRSSAAQALTGINSIDGTAANVANALTFKNDGTGAVADSTYNGGTARNISYNSIGAAPVGQQFYLGTTQIAINRGSGAIALTGITSIDGNAATVTNGVYTNGSYADPAWITSLNYSKLTGTVTTWNQDTTGTAAKANKLLGEDGSQRSAVYSANTAYSIMQRDASGNVTAGTFSGNLSGNATTANYADLAEKYTTDVEYDPGTVVMVGGDEEVTAVTGPDCWVLGVISTNPAHLMNAGANGQPIALTGRVPVKLNVAVKKGDPIYPDVDGGATNVSNGRHPFGFALTTTTEPGLVECAIK